MNTCPNDLVCHDQGECLRPTPETDVYATHKNDVYEFVDSEWDWVVSADFARRIERERNDARELLASEKSTRNAIIAKGVEMERQLAEAREENVRLLEVVKDAREALDTCAQFIQDAHIIEAQWDWEPVEQSKKAIEAIAKLNTTP